MRADQSYCMKCHKGVVAISTRKTTFKGTGRPRLAGKCPYCGSATSRALPGTGNARSRSKSPKKKSSKKRKSKKSKKSKKTAKKKKSSAAKKMKRCKPGHHRKGSRCVAV